MEEADEQELANIAHGEEHETHKQAMESPDANEWLAAECYELDQLAQLDTYQLICHVANLVLVVIGSTTLNGIQIETSSFIKLV